MINAIRVALDSNLNPIIYGTETMKHLQYANHYRDILKTMKKAGYLNSESIPMKDQYTTCLKSPTSPDGEDWELRVLAGSMTLKMTSNGRLMLTQHNMEFEEFVGTLNINSNSPTAIFVRGKLNLMKTLTKLIGTVMSADSKRTIIRTRSKESLGRITNNLKENRYV